MQRNDEDFLREALELAYRNAEAGGRPFGALVVKDSTVLASGVNEILLTNDPTAHAEMSALRKASQALGSPQLQGCVVYASGHPCPMCFAAMRMSGVSRVVYALSNDDAAPYGLSTSAIYEELSLPFPQQSMPITHLPIELEGKTPLYSAWRSYISSSEGLDSSTR